MFKKKSYSVQMSYNVSDAEKSQAEKAIMGFSYAQKILKQASDHLNIMLTPFKDHNDITPEQVNTFRAAIRRFRDKSIENFNDFKIAAFKCIKLMQMFSSDTQTVKIMKSFINAIGDIEEEVNNFSNLFSNLDSKSFNADIIASIEKIKKECDELNDIIDERIKSHLQNNILGKNWTDGISDELDMRLEKETPLMLELFNQREKEIG